MCSADAMRTEAYDVRATAVRLQSRDIEATADKLQPLHKGYRDNKST